MCRNPADQNWELGYVSEQHREVMPASSSNLSVDKFEFGIGFDPSNPILGISLRFTYFLHTVN